VETSILKSVKKVLGLDPEYTAFDADILMHINSAFSTLTQIGIGPETGFMIEDDTAVWASIIGSDPNLNSVKTYVYLKLRLQFDPPGTAYLVDAVKEQIREYEWRLNVYMEHTIWTPPVTEDLPDDESLILDGGGP